MTGETNEIRAAFAKWWSSPEARELLREAVSDQRLALVAFARGAGYGADVMHSHVVAATAVEIARSK